MLAQNCAKKRHCIIKADFVIDIDSIIQLSPQTEGQAVFVTWNPEISSRKYLRNTSRKETSRSFVRDNKATWNAPGFSEDGAASAHIVFSTTIAQDPSTWSFKRKELLLTLRKAATGATPAIAKAVINVAEFAEHNTDVELSIPLQSKRSVPPIMTVSISIICCCSVTLTNTLSAVCEQFGGNSMERLWLLTMIWNLMMLLFMRHLKLEDKNTS